MLGRTYYKEAAVHKLELLSVRVDPSFRSELICVIAPDFFVGVDYRSRHADNCTSGQILATDGSSTIRHESFEWKADGRM